MPRITARASAVSCMIAAVLVISACGTATLPSGVDESPTAPSFLYSAEYYGLLFDAGCDPVNDPRCKLRALSQVPGNNEYQIVLNKLQTLCVEVREAGMNLLTSGHIKVWDAYLSYEDPETGAEKYSAGDWHGDGEGGNHQDEIHLWVGNWAGSYGHQFFFGETLAHEILHYLDPDKDHDQIWAEGAACAGLS